jgi:hypothetical protein
MKRSCSSVVHWPVFRWTDGGGFLCGGWLLLLLLPPLLSVVVVEEGDDDNDDDDDDDDNDALEEQYDVEDVRTIADDLSGTPEMFVLVIMKLLIIHLHYLLFQLTNAASS